ncbi:hypothetical protein DCO56_19995 [Sphingobacterium athyrii]|uniref:Uncharacterized protein n=1 Tax=Sphingobacterium athyrii TaxID=2152717 RepID=A0A363NNW7_9SPHI|nr:hypothetical protein DCO56_19995 [Sphingobacterium athyrii]
MPMPMNFIALKNLLIHTLFIITNFLTSPQKTGAFKSREFGDELLILKGRKSDSTDRLCDQTVRDRYPCGKIVIILTELVNLTS